MSGFSYSRFLLGINRFTLSWLGPRLDKAVAPPSRPGGGMQGLTMPLPPPVERAGVTPLYDGLIDSRINHGLVSFRIDMP